MENLFKRTSANWVRYDRYEYKENANGILYLTPCKDATMSLYNPINEYEELVLTALGIGLDILQKKESEDNIKGRVLLEKHRIYYPLKSTGHKASNALFFNGTLNVS